MKTIYIKRINKNLPLPTINVNGDFIDLYCSERVEFRAPKAIEENNTVLFDFKLIKLGVAIQLPKGFEAILVSRSGTGKKHGISNPNGFGVIDNSFSGDNDEWRFPAISFRKTVLSEGTPFCQFKIQLSQKATVWQKISWLFSKGIKIEEVDTLHNEDRGGGCIRAEETKN